MVAQMTAGEEYAAKHEQNGLGMNGSEYHARYNGVPTVDFAERGLKITRLRLLTDPGFPYMDVSYCHGEFQGKPCNVYLPFQQLNKRTYKTDLVKYAKATGHFIPGLFDSLSIAW